MEGDFLPALRENGDAYGKAMGLDTSISEVAMSSGAKTAGISGCGPATVILSDSAKTEDVLKALEGKGKIISTKINSEKAGII